MELTEQFDIDKEKLDKGEEHFVLWAFSRKAN